MKNNATCTIRSEEITIDVRICAALAANRGGEVYLAAIILKRFPTLDINLSHHRNRCD